MFNGSNPFNYTIYNSLPLQVWLNNINNTDTQDELDSDQFTLTKPEIIPHIKHYLDRNEIDYNYLAKSIYKNICNNLKNKFDDLEIYNYLNKYYMNNQDFLINVILDLININKTYDLYDVTKLNGIEKVLVKNFSNDIMKIISEKSKKQHHHHSISKQPDNVSVLEKKIATLENNIKMLVDEINKINGENNILKNNLKIMDENYQQLKDQFNNMNGNYINLKTEFNDIKHVLHEIMEHTEKDDTEQEPNINFVIKDVERIGDNIANEFYKIIN